MQFKNLIIISINDSIIIITKLLIYDFQLSDPKLSTLITAYFLRLTVVLRSVEYFHVTITMISFIPIMITSLCANSGKIYSSERKFNLLTNKRSKLNDVMPFIPFSHQR
jgi:hypothetical protein